MTDSDRPRFSVALVALADVFGGELSATSQALYFAALADLSWEALQLGFRRAVAECRFLPRPVELRELAVGPAESSEDQTECAWLAWRHAAQRVGSYESLWFADRALAATLDAMFGGWPEACVAEFSDEMWAAKRKEFGRIYRVMRNRVDGEGAVRLPGQHERTNLLAGRGAPQLRGDRPLLTLAGRVDWHPDRNVLTAGESPRALAEVQALPQLEVKSGDAC